MNQYPGAGLDQAPRQSDPDTGPDEGAPIGLVDDGFEFPAVDEVIRVTITPAGS